jgi:uncharacterized membrane protein YwzB
MLNNMITVNLTTKHYASLAAIMLLAPLVPLSLKSNDIELSIEEEKYIADHIQFGNYILSVAIGAGALWSLNAFVTKNAIMNSISTRLSVLCLVMIFVGIYTIIKNTTVQQLTSSLHIPWKK